MKNLDTHDYLLDLQFEKTPVAVDGVAFYQIGKKICRPDTVIPPHFHIDWFEFTVVISGKGKIYTNSETEYVTVSSGDVYLSLPADIHKIESDAKDPLTYSFFSFRLQDTPFVADFAKVAHVCCDSAKRLVREERLPALIDILLDELTENREHRAEVLSSTLSLLMTFTVRATLMQNAAKSSMPIGKNELLCYKMMRYLDRNVMSIRALSELSTELHYNYSYLCKIFRATTGRTVSEYLSEQRIERAKLLVLGGAHTFTEIAELLGFASLFSFSKSFRYYVGCSPRAFRKKQK